MNIAIIPARSGSKRIKNKNIVSIAGKPIIYFPILAAKIQKFLILSMFQVTQIKY